MPKFERGNFSVETENDGPEFAEEGMAKLEKIEKSDEEMIEPLVAKFEVKPEIKTEEVQDKDGNGVDDEDDDLIVKTFKGSKAEESGTSGKVESLISKTDSAILHKERDPYKFLNYWRRMKVVAMEEWFNRKIGAGNAAGKKSEEAHVGEGQESDKTLEILQGRRKEDIQTNVVENVEEKQGQEQVGVVENTEEKGGETAA